MLENLRISKAPANRKRWVLSSSALPQVLHNKVTMLNRNLLSSSTGYLQCSMVGSFHLAWEMAYELKSPVALLKSNIFNPMRDLSPVQWRFGKAKSIITLVHKCSYSYKDNCIVSKKCIYGLVQAERQYYKKAIETLKKAGFVGGSVIPCLYVKKRAKVVVFIALFEDDNLGRKPQGHG